MTNTKLSVSTVELSMRSGLSLNILILRCVLKILTREFNLALKDPKSLLQYHPMSFVGPLLRKSSGD
jgi:hypothetical protein